MRFRGFSADITRPAPFLFAIDNHMQSSTHRFVKVYWSATPIFEAYYRWPSRSFHQLLFPSQHRVCLVSRRLSFSHCMVLLGLIIWPLCSFCIALFGNRFSSPFSWSFLVC